MHIFTVVNSYALFKNVHSFECVQSKALPLISIIFFVTFTTLTAFMVLSLFVGTVTLGMIESLQLIDEIVAIADAHEAQRLKVTRTWVKSNQKEKKNLTYTQKTNFSLDHKRNGKYYTDDNVLQKLSYKIITSALNLDHRMEQSKGRWTDNMGSDESLFDRLRAYIHGMESDSLSTFIAAKEASRLDDVDTFVDIEIDKSEHLQCFQHLPRPVYSYYIQAAKLCKHIVDGAPFELFMIILVVITAVLLGSETVEVSHAENVEERGASCGDIEARHNNRCESSTGGTPSKSSRLTIAQDIIIFFFVVESLMKIIAEGAAPQRYFRSSANIFDFTVTVIAVVAIFLEGSFNAGLFRLFRLLQLLRTFSKVVF